MIFDRFKKSKLIEIVNNSNVDIKVLYDITSRSFLIKLIEENSLREMGELTLSEQDAKNLIKLLQMYLKDDETK